MLVQVVLVVLVLGVLGVIIGVLVTVLNIQSDSSLTSQPATVSTTSAANATTTTIETTSSSTSRSTTSAPRQAVSDSKSLGCLDGGVPEPEVVDSKDARFASFKQVDEMLKAWMDTTINPCDDFCNYACKTGNDKALEDPWAQSADANDEMLVNKYLDNKFFENAITPLQQLKHLFDKCVNSDATEEELNDIMKQEIGGLKAQAGVNFPLIYQNEQVDSLSPEQLAKLVGFAFSNAGLPSFIPIEVFQDYKEPDEAPARVYLDPPELPYDQDYYTFWDDNKEGVTNNIVTTCNFVATSILGLPDLDQDKLTNDAAAVAEIGYALGSYVAQRARPDYESQYNLLKLSYLQTAAPAFNWVEFMKSALNKADAADKIDDDLEIVVVDPDNLIKLSNDIIQGKFATFTALANYVQFFALNNVKVHLPPLQATASTNIFTISSKMKGVMPTQHRRVGVPLRPLSYNPRLHNNLKPELAIDDNIYYCYTTAKYVMIQANDRLFVDAAYPTPKAKADIKQQLNELSKWMISGFRSQIDTLNWMLDDSKKGAYAKLDNIVLNIAFPEWIVLDEKLINFYKDLTFTTTDKTVDVFQAAYNFKLTQYVVNFRLQNKRNRHDFENIGITNAFYTPMENAMTIPGGILNAPFYDPNYPAAIKFGGITYLTGHELTHGFDDKGVQFDGLGALKGWMDQDSMKSFRSMADCVVNEYSALCPLPNTYSHPCVNGEQTQGENIADGGGIQAAYKAFKAYEAFNGPDPRLPSFGSVFNNDQLFFLSFANIWCGGNDEGWIEYLIETDDHSPNIDRVLGTLQNFPAFRAAFNCPVGHPYSPADHCNVWTSPPF